MQYNYQNHTLQYEELTKLFQQAYKHICSRVIDREEVIEQAILALLTGEHLLLQSRTGAGKTLLAEQIFSMFEGARLFKVQASREQQPDTYFGGLEIEELKKGRLIHNTDGSLIESEFGFIDEIFDANDFTLRALLSVLNERALVRGVQNVPAATHTVIAATNYLRVSEVTEALLDRFVYKAVIMPDKSPYKQYRIGQKYLAFSGGISQPAQRIPFSLLKYVHGIVTGKDTDTTIEVAPEILYLSGLVVRHYEFLRTRADKQKQKSGGVTGFDFYISPRTQAKAVDLLRALALLKGRKSVLMEDVSKLFFIFTTLGVEEERQLFQSAYTTIHNSLSAARGYEQLSILLSLDSLLHDIRNDRTLLDTPLTSLKVSPLRKTFFDWIKEKFTGGESTQDTNKRILTTFLSEFIPACDEVRELKTMMEHEIHSIIKLYYSE